MHRYFAAANSADGFVCWFDDIFPPEAFTHTYILKGGSGTGKSTLLKKAASRLEKSGAAVEYFHCSSDPGSLDGITAHLPDGRSFAMLDGTSPHTRDPRYPGACETIVNPGDFWDADALFSHRGEIISLTREKSACFSTAYGWFESAARIRRRLRAEIGGMLLSQKLDAAAGRFLRGAMQERHIKPTGAPVVRIRALSALSAQGEVHFDSFAEESEHVVRAVDLAGSLPFLFDALMRQADALGLCYDRAPVPLEPSLTEALRFPALSLAVVSHTDADTPRALNMSRFVDRDALAASDRRRRRMLAKTADELIDAGLAKLSEVKKLHASLESIYIAAMDFERMNAETAKILESLS